MSLRVFFSFVPMRLAWRSANGSGPVKRKYGGHALYDVALNLVFLGLQYVTPGESVASRTRSKKSA